LSSTYQNIIVVGMVDRLLYQLFIPAAFLGKLAFVMLIVSYLGNQPSL
jgi:hypothetical protein